MPYPVHQETNPGNSAARLTTSILFRRSLGSISLSRSSSLGYSFQKTANKSGQKSTSFDGFSPSAKEKVCQKED
jgi:hypothetical protein